MKSSNMLIECAWCGASLGIRQCETAHDGKVTHGICQPCKERQMAHDVVPESFAPVTPVSCAVSSATARRDGHNFDAGQDAEPSRNGPVARTATPEATAQASTPPVAAAGVEFISVVDLAEICGISSYRLDTQFRPYDWAAPRELRWNGRTLLYAFAALPALLERLTTGGLYDAALKLGAWMDKRQHPAATAVPWYRKGAME
jgi:hypothetical protein